MDVTVAITSDLLWRSALVAALVDAPLLALIAFFIPGELFHRLKWYLVVAAFLVYAVIWGAFGSLLFWEAVYHAIFPAWFRWLLPLIYGILSGTLALLFWRMSLLVPRWQALVFCLCGGMYSLVGHAIGISRGLMQAPMLVEASVTSALTFGVFEFIFYWCLIVALGLLGWWIHRYIVPNPGS
jgi:hypothetical protein